MTVFSSNTPKMLEINKEDFSHLGIKIENMLDVIINGDKIIFNSKIMNQNNNLQKHNRVNKNVEIEILLIEINKILIKLEKISQNCFNKLKGNSNL